MAPSLLPNFSTVVLPGASDTSFRGFSALWLALCSQSIIWLKVLFFCEFDSYLIIYCVLLSFVERLKHKRVKIFSDNQSAARVLSFGVFKVHTVGGSKRFSCLFSHGIALEAQWIPRSLTGKADLLRRFIDENDSPVNPYVFRVVEAKWGPRTKLNRFTSYYRAFSFRVLTPSLLLLVVGVSDAFVRDWSGKDNWIFFPVCLVVVA